MTLANHNEVETRIQNLNPEQQKAVFHKEGPGVVFAGAGSGKTRVIITRIAYLISQGTLPQSILAVTFTNKAAKEMRERLYQINPGFQPTHVGTFHSACARWLREFATELGFSSDFTIYDDKDSLQAMKVILKDYKDKIIDYSPRDYLRSIAGAKTQACLPMEAEKLLAVDPKFFPPLGVEIYGRYQNYLTSCNAMDFNDLLMNVLILLRSHQLVRQTLQYRYKYILIDEYQDTNPTQFSLINLLVNQQKNLFVVGDDDQSIYSWRGANPYNIINFKDSYPDANIFHLEQNYRSSGCIVSAASEMIQKNTKRSPKTLWTQRDFGDKIEYRCEYDAETEAWFIADSLLEEKEKYSYNNIAILYRTNAQSRQIEDILRKKKIPYRIYGSLRFYDRAEIKDLLSYCRLLANYDDDIAFRRIINLPPRGIGKKAIESLEDYARNSDLSLFKATCEIVKKNNSRVNIKLQGFVKLIEDLQNFLDKNLLEDFLIYLLEQTNYRPYLEKKYPEQLQDKIANIHELGSAISEYAQETPQAKLVHWLKEVALVDNERAENSFSDEEEAETVQLMTLHAAKGLEFLKVYIIGVEDGLIPHTNSMESTESLEEERRLLYVGMTRAQKRLFLISAQRRRVLNNWVSYPVSRFFEDIPLHFFSHGTTEKKRMTENNSIEIGTKVYHSKYKSGVVKNIEVNCGTSQITVEFKFYGLKKVDAKKIKKLALIRPKKDVYYDYNI